MAYSAVRREHLNVRPPKPCHTWVKREGRTVCMTCGDSMPQVGPIKVCRQPSRANLRTARLSGWTRKMVVGKRTR